MKKLFVPLVLGLTMAASGSALAWSHVTGSITSIDTSAHRIVLDNGNTYSLQSGVKLSNLAVGDKVTVNTETKNGENLVNKVTKTS